MEEILHQLICSYLIIYRVLYIPGGAGFLPSTVCHLMTPDLNLQVFVCKSGNPSPSLLNQFGIKGPYRCRSKLNTSKEELGRLPGKHSKVPFLKATVAGFRCKVDGNSQRLFFR